MEIKSIEEKIGTKWLAFNSATYLDKNGKEMKWDFVSRKGNTKVVTVICHSKTSGKYLLIMQPRVPLNKMVIEFPAGLVDAGESFITAAQRELKEETGYEGEVVSESPLVCKSAGLTDESTAVVEMLVDEKAVGKTEMESTEDIQSFWKTPAEFLQWVKKMDPKNYIVDTCTYFYFIGKAGGNTPSSKKASSGKAVKASKASKKTTKATKAKK